MFRKYSFPITTVLLARATSFNSLLNKWPSNNRESFETPSLDTSFHLHARPTPGNTESRKNRVSSMHDRICIVPQETKFICSFAKCRKDRQRLPPRNLHTEITPGSNETQRNRVPPTDRKRKRFPGMYRSPGNHIYRSSSERPAV